MIAEGQGEARVGALQSQTARCQIENRRHRNTVPREWRKAPSAQETYKSLDCDERHKK